MGGAAAARAVDEGHEVGVVLTSQDASRAPAETAALLRGHGAAIDFSTGPAVLAHVAACMQAGGPLVAGTTGGEAGEGEARRAAGGAGGAEGCGGKLSTGGDRLHPVGGGACPVVAGLPPP